MCFAGPGRRNGRAADEGSHGQPRDHGSQWQSTPQVSTLTALPFLGIASCLRGSKICSHLAVMMQCCGIEAEVSARDCTSDTTRATFPCRLLEPGAAERAVARASSPAAVRAGRISGSRSRCSASESEHGALQQCTEPGQPHPGVFGPRQRWSVTQPSYLHNVINSGWRDVDVIRSTLTVLDMISLEAFAPSTLHCNG